MPFQRHACPAQQRVCNAVQATSAAVQQSEAVRGAQRAWADALGPSSEVDIPEKHAFLAERLAEFNATIPYEGFSREFLAQLARPGRFEREARRKAHATLEAVFCLLPAPKKVRVGLVCRL